MIRQSEDPDCSRHFSSHPYPEPCQEMDLDLLLLFTLSRRVKRAIK